MNPRFFVRPVIAVLVALYSLRAQTTEKPSDTTPTNKEAIEPPLFLFGAEKVTSYAGKTVLSSTRIALDIAEAASGAGGV